MSLREASEGPWLGLLGLARRARAVRPGVDACRTAIRSGDAHLIVVAGDASPGQLEKVSRIARHRGVPVLRIGTQVGLGRALGAPPLSALAVTDRSLAARVLNTVPGKGPEEGF